MEKIKNQHLHRRAIVYVRQSTVHQVRQNQESKRLQYAMRERMVGLGWEDVTVIDDDLGLSATDAQRRSGFQDMLAQVCRGEVGAIAAREVSRFCRNNRDWAQLVEFCSMFETLLVDSEAIYDARLSNDRLLLGLKGNLSEYELDLLRHRAAEARLQKAKRGELILRAPVGYVKSHRSTLVKDPDTRVQNAIAQVFEKFFELGSARQVHLWLTDQCFEMPIRRYGVAGLETHWAPPAYAAILSILSSPTYAGAYLYGRTKTISEISDGSLRRRLVRQPLEQCYVLLYEHHDGYISRHAHERIQDMLRGNMTQFSASKPGAAKKGIALLTGLMRCGACGGKLGVHYSGNKTSARYFCRRGHDDPNLDPCMSFGTGPVDSVISEAIVEVVQPAAVEAAQLASEISGERHRDILKRLETDLEAARYDCGHAQKQYDATDPENRLVADELERRWESSLRRVRDLEKRITEVKNGDELESSDSSREPIRDLARRLDLVWNSPSADVQIKKRIVRALVEEIVAKVNDDKSAVLLTIHWQGGVHTETRARRHRRGENSAQNPPNVVEAVRHLALVCNDEKISAYLNRQHIRTGRGNRWTRERVASLRSKRKIPAYSSGDQQRSGWFNLRDASTYLGISETPLRRAARDGIIRGLHPLVDGPWIFNAKDLDTPATQAFVRSLRGREGPAFRAAGQLSLNNLTT